MRQCCKNWPHAREGIWTAHISGPELIVQSFESLPGGIRHPLGRPAWGDDRSRSGHGLSLQRMTGQSACVYCGVDLIGDFHRWLLIQVDHVVPAGEARRMGRGGHGKAARDIALASVDPWHLPVGHCAALAGGS